VVSLSEALMDFPDKATVPFSRETARYSWLVVAMLWFVCFLNYADRQAIFSLFSLLKKEFALSDVQLGIVAACFMWAYSICGPVAGWISDRVSRSHMVIGALCFWSVMTGATAWAHSYHSLLWLRMLGGLGEAFYFPAAMSLIASYHGSTTRSRAMALHQSSVYAGTIGGGAMSAYVAERTGWRSSFEIFGALGILLALVLLFFLRDPVAPVDALGQPDPKREKVSGNLVSNLREMVANKGVLVMIAVFMGANFVAVIFLTWMPTFLQRKFNMHLGAAAFNSTAYIQAASVIGVIAGGFLADFFCRRWTGGRQLVQAIGLLGGVPFLFFTGHSLTVRVLISSMLGFGLFKGLYDANIWASLYDFVKPEQRGFATGLMNSLGWLGAGFAPIAVAAAASRYSLSICISMTAAIYFLLVLPLYFLFLKRSNALPSAPPVAIDHLNS